MAKQKKMLIVGYGFEAMCAAYACKELGIAPYVLATTSRFNSGHLNFLEHLRVPGVTTGSFEPDVIYSRIKLYAPMYTINLFYLCRNSKTKGLAEKCVQDSLITISLPEPIIFRQSRIDDAVNYDKRLYLAFFADAYGRLRFLKPKDCTISLGEKTLFSETVHDNKVAGGMEKILAETFRKLNKTFVGAGKAIFMYSRGDDKLDLTELQPNDDFVKENIELATGRSISKIGRKQYLDKGHTIECCIYANNPAQNLALSRGEITDFDLLRSEASRHLLTICNVVKLVSPVYTRHEGEITVFYSVTSEEHSLLAKAVVTGRARIGKTAREDAQAKLCAVLSQIQFEGIATTLDMQYKLVLSQLFGTENYRICDVSLELLNEEIMAVKQALLKLKETKKNR